jgi:hypothetical protein
VISSVTNFQFQFRIIDQLYTIDPSRIDIRGPKVIAYPLSMPNVKSRKCRVVLSYNGGLGATLADLPRDMVEAVTILAIRFYREAESGLADQMGMAEFGTTSYTKAWPVRITQVIKKYKRQAGWRYLS